ncbi:putative bifunctional diguanylate cyclase/phosphodiesterase [Ochrobactrum teleogrylli]|nr:bifunctional diguanylate cyclase/phosphodiesterase [[Ochrobactrum] teleogrylli]
MAKRKAGPVQAGSSMASTPQQDFRILFTTHPTPMWVYDPQTLGFIIMNDAAYALYGYTPDELPGMTVLDIRPHTERERMLSAVRDRSDLERPERWQHRRADGEIIEVLTYGREVQFDGREAILAIVQDRTELAKANRQAIHAQSLLDSLVSNLPLGVFIKDMQDDGRYVLYNQAASRASGKAVDAVVGFTDAQLMSDLERRQYAQQDRQVMSKGEALSVEYKSQHDDGTQRILRVIKSSIPPVEGGTPRYLIGLIEDVTERREIEERMAHIAMHDSLTRLPNRAAFSHHVEELLKKRGDAEPFALFCIDIDHFKSINDNIGHQAGDQLLQQVAERLRQITTSDQFIARLGGDEFAVIYRSGTVGQIAMFADRVLSAFQEPFRLGDNSEFVTCSMGIAQAPLHGDNSDVLMRNADLALNASKSSGRRTFHFYQHSLRLAAEKRHIMTSELRQALLSEQFELHYQPIFNLESGLISGFEALIRWRHPERGMVSPAEFIPLAEETGLIGPIGDWVLLAACREAVSWPEDIKVSVNLSPVQFSQTSLLRSVTDALDAARLSPNRLELEITESVFLSNSKHNIELLFELRRLGARIAMDDFGTGYSSLSYLRSFPFDKIKIDRSFVSGIEADTRDLAIIQAVATLGAGFNIVTTAEGVETAQQLERLRTERFGEVQGYLTGRPMPASDVHAFIQSNNGTGLAMPAAHNRLPV